MEIFLYKNVTRKIFLSKTILSYICLNDWIYHLSYLKNSIKYENSKNSGFQKQKMKLDKDLWFWNP